MRCPLRPPCQVLTRRKVALSAFSPRNDSRSTCLPQSVVSCVARNSLSFAGTALCMSIGCRGAQRCLTSRDLYWLRVVVCTSSASKSRSLGESILPRGKIQASGLATEVLPDASHARATCSRRHPAAMIIPATRHELPRRRPTHGSTRQDAVSGPGGRAASCRARRTAARALAMLQRVPSAVVAASGAPLAAAHLKASCG